MRNRIRGILDQVARRLPAGGKAFSQAGRQQWEKDLGRKLEECAQDELWRGMILTELSRLRELEGAHCGRWTRSWGRSRRRMNGCSG